MNTRFATRKSLLATFAFFRANPAGRVRVDWCTSWGESEFRSWFRRCLLRKINSFDTRPVPGGAISDEHYNDLKLDAQAVNDHARGIRRSGRNLLRTPEMIRRYPHVHNCGLE